MTMITDPAQIQAFHFLQVKSALKIEVRTGMKFSSKGSPLKMAQQMGYTDQKTKVKALAQMQAYWEANMI